MPLNKLENFIKNTEGRILYVNPNDLDATDGIENQGNSLTKPFKTIQRALIESARFSYVRGADNDITEKTTILLFPGEHIVDNRPGFKIKTEDGIAKVVKQNGDDDSFAQDELTLTLNSNFDLTQEDNILHKFNSFNGGAIVPRGTSIVGLDLRKTKIRPKYVPNPTDDNIPSSAIFRVTGACYFWQFTFFDGLEGDVVYTDPVQFDESNRSSPLFSHHKLTCFEYADGVNIAPGFEQTDLDMYYDKLSNAFNRASGREIVNSEKYPNSTDTFAKQRAEFEIVGAFETDPISVSSLISGDGATPGNIVTVTTSVDHGLSAGTPIKIRNVDPVDYNISTKVVEVLSDNKFTYALPFVRNNLPAGPQGGLNASTATITVETDTVTGASPYIFNVSLRSVWGMQGMHADGRKATGFRSMVVAQFTAISLQKDDRAFVSYNQSNRKYSGLIYDTVSGAELSAQSSSTDPETVFHLDPNAIYRRGWETTHVKMSNDAVVQIVSVFAIGFNKHFESLSGGDASITNSNSNFGQLSLISGGYKKEAFGKDNKGYISHIISPRSVTSEETNIEWLQVDIITTATSGKNNHIYLHTYTNRDIAPPIISQGYRIGARVNERVYFKDIFEDVYSAKIYMNDTIISESTVVSNGTNSSEKRYIANGPTGANSIITFTTNHQLSNGETIRILSGTGDLPENIVPNRVYYAVTRAKNVDRADGVDLGFNQIQIASSLTNANAKTPVVINTFVGGVELEVVSRVSDKAAGEPGHPVQWDYQLEQWYVHAEADNEIYTYCVNNNGATPEDFTDISYVLRKEDSRSLDERLYKLRYVVPKELVNGRGPVEGFVIQESSSTSVRSDSDFTLQALDTTDPSFYDYNRNPKFIHDVDFDVITDKITIESVVRHDLFVGDQVIIKNVASDSNPAATENLGYNGTFIVTDIVDDHTFKYSEVDTSGVTHIVGTFTGDSQSRVTTLPRFERNDNQKSFYGYRSETITPYIEGVQDGIYHIFPLKSDITIDTEFTDRKYSQNITDLYPQLDRDNLDENPPSAKSFAKRTPLGEVVTNNLKSSLTRECTDDFLSVFAKGLNIIDVSYTSTEATLTFDRPHGLNGIVNYTTLNGGAGHVEGTYYDVKLYNQQFSDNWDGARAKVIVDNSGQVSSASITEGGSAYSTGDQMWLDSSVIGGARNANIIIDGTNISNSNSNYFQITGIGTAESTYQRVSSIDNTTQITVARASDDPIINVGQFAINVGKEIIVSQSSYETETEISTFDSGTEPHGLLSGNKFRILDANNNNLGDYIVDTVVTPTRFKSKTKNSLSSAGFALKHFLSANAGFSGDEGENLGARGLYFYDNEILTLAEGVDNQAIFAVNLPSGAAGIIERFPLGSYIQIDNEVMRIVSSTLQGVGNNEITVRRGCLGTVIESHDNGSLIKKIDIIPIELRRPSILRASGHTFEYLGYGPGNYSTGLPQLQLKTLTETEEFLSQSQETEAGQVIYTGMNSDGDFYIGNTKYSAQSGEQSVFDVPVPTITGEDPNRLSVVFDEVIVKERILVEGGNSSQILSQFDGPVTFNETVRMNSPLVLSDDLRVDGKAEFKNDTQSTDWNNGAVIFKGGIGIAKDVNIKGSTDIDVNLNVDGSVGFTTDTDNTLNNVDTGGVQIDCGVGIARNVSIGGSIYTNGEVEIDGQTSIYDSLIVKSDDEDFKIQTGAGVDKFTVDSDTGNTVIEGTLNITDDVAVNTDKFTITASNGNTVTQGSLQVDGNVTFGNEITDTITANGRFNASLIPSADNTYDLGSVTVPLARWRNLWIQGTADVEFLEVDQNADITGNLVVDGNVTLGDANSDNITINGQIVNSLIPDSNDSYDLGSDDLEWKDLWIDGTAHIDTLDVDGSATITSDLTVNGNVTLGDSANDDNITINGQIVNSLIPDSNDSYDLGSDDLEWKDLWIDGTAHIDTLDVDGSAEITSNLTVNGNVDLGNSTSDSVSIEGSIDTPLIPTGSQNIGADATRWQNLYLESVIYWPNGTNTYDMVISNDGTNGLIQHRVGGTSSALILDSAGGNGVVLRKVGTDGTGAETLALFKDDTFALSHGNTQRIISNADECTIQQNTVINGSLQVQSDITAFYASDERLKDNITSIDDPLEKVLSLGGYTFDWNENSDKEGSDTGVIAQQVEALGLPGLTTTRDNGYKAVRYEKLVPLLIEAIKDLTDKVSKLEDRLNQ